MVGSCGRGGCAKEDEAITRMTVPTAIMVLIIRDPEEQQ
jgi:hypothetical protein